VVARGVSTLLISLALHQVFPFQSWIFTLDFNSTRDRLPIHVSPVPKYRHVCRAAIYAGRRGVGLVGVESTEAEAEA
jgi:hypothetical protein